MGGQGDLQAPDVAAFLRRLGGVVVVAGEAAQLGLDPRHQLQGIEGLGDIVVGAQGEAGDFVHVLHPRRQHDDGKEVVLPNFLAKGKAVQIRQHHVENGQINGRLLQNVQCGGSRQRLVHGKALVG